MRVAFIRDSCYCQEVCSPSHERKTVREADDSGDGFARDSGCYDRLTASGVIAIIIA